MHPIDCKGKCFTKTELINANKAAINENRNRQLREDFLESLPDDGLFPIVLAFDEHNKGEIRVKIVFDEEGNSEFLDLSKKRYNFLPILSFNSDGTFELVRTESRPYPLDRHYEEKVVRKTVRDKNFRKNILSAYGGQCAMCDVKSLLVAAHIYPAHLCGDDSVNNGICLCPTHDRAYESGIVCIKPDGEIISYSDDIRIDYRSIRFPLDVSNYPSPERLDQRLKLSMRKLGINDKE